MVKKKRPNTPSNTEIAKLDVQTTDSLPDSGITPPSTSSTSDIQQTTEITAAQVCETSSPVPPDVTGAEEKKDKVPIFKDPSFVHSNKSGQAAYKRTRVWKNLKQIIAAERLLQWGPDDVTYATLEAPPSFKPAKKYSDISGLEAKYTDPQTKLRYASSEEFSRIRTLPADLISGYLALRKANNPVP